MTGLGDFVQLTGVALAGLTIFFYHRLVSNHLEASKKSMDFNTQAIEKLIHWLKEHKCHERS